MNEQDAAICTQVGNSLIAKLNQFIASNIGTETEKMINIMALTFEEELRLAGLEGARQELRLLRKQGKINNTTMMAIITKLDLRQISLVGNQRNYELHTQAEHKTLTTEEINQGCSTMVYD
ncbi:hypothetical protein [Legionella tunisiensis]|uniref:hypothetical protein n=1 Tax=Legionella tunisiensis TaxID=1034944 RepID=UPI001E35EB4E|nr:hypothetical protein [Legionella tunisiensis]